MGAEQFDVVVLGEDDVRTAFAAAREQAQYDYGHAGYTGTIAEKDSVVVIHDRPVPVETAQEMAERLSNARTRAWTTNGVRQARSASSPRTTSRVGCSSVGRVREHRVRRADTGRARQAEPEGTACGAGQSTTTWTTWCG